MTELAALVVGSSGYLGRQIIHRLLKKTEVITTHHVTAVWPKSAPFDFHRDDIDPLIRDQNVGTIIFASAVENAPTDLVRAGIKRFVEACRNKRLIYLSSDAVFDGQLGMYSEQDVPSANSLYGTNLRLCEEIISGRCENFCIVRPSYIYGYADGMLDVRLNRTLLALTAGKRVELFDNMYKSPLGVAQVADAVVEIALGNYNGICHVAGSRMSVHEFHSRAMQTLLGNADGVVPCQMPKDSKLPRDTSLKADKWVQFLKAQPMGIEETLTIEP